jgi:hypothetical protein
MSSFEQLATDTSLHPALEGNETPIAHGEMKQRLLFRHAVFVAAMVFAMTG